MQQAANVCNVVVQSLKKYLPAKSRVLLAVSGGADSMALAMGTVQLMQSGYLQAAVMHVEHGLRGAEALRDANLVEEFCAKYKIPYSCRHVDVAAYAKEHGLSTESAARTLRYEALQNEAKRLHMDYIVTAHHADDQAETVLLKLLRGASGAGLSGMSAMHGNIVRPFLELGRADLVSYCEAMQVPYCHDSSNDDTVYTRNRIRKELLPYLERQFNPSVRRALLQTAALLNEDEAYFSQLVENEAARRVQNKNSSIKLNAANWQKLPASIRKRLLRQTYFMSGGSELSYEQTNALDGMCLKRHSGKRINLGGRITAAYAYDVLQFLKPWGEKNAGNAQNEKTAFAVQLEAPRHEPVQVKLTDGLIELRCIKGSLKEVLAEYAGAENVQQAAQKNVLLYPMELLDGQLVLRKRQNGDRFAPYGGAGSKKLKDYLIDKKVPQAERGELLLLCCGDKILGIFTLAAGFWKHGEYKSWLLAKYTARER